MVTPDDIDPPYVQLEPGKRLLLNPVLLELLGWNKHASDFKCFGFIHSPRHFVCAPEWLRTTQDRHPLASLREDAEPAAPPDVLEMPSLGRLGIPWRNLTFDAKWASEERKQLNLYVGKALISRLAGLRDDGTFVSKRACAFPHAGILTLVDERLGADILILDPGPLLRRDA